jgi:LytS/YehU family sensor histidine kinase
MDAANLAIVFAPTILMDGKAPIISSKDMSVAITADQLEQGKGVLKMMIEQYKELFMVQKDLHNKICIGLYETDSLQLMRALAFKVQKGCG